MPFFVAGGLAFAVMPFAMGFLPETLREGNGVEKKRTKLSWQVLGDPLFILFTFNFGLSFTMAMFESTFAWLAAVKAGFGPAQMGTTFAIIGIFDVIVQGMLIGKLVKRFGDANLVKFGSVLCAVGLVAIFLAPNTVLLIISAIIFMIGNSLMGPTSLSLVTKQGTEGQGATLGLFQSFGSLGRILRPVVGGALYELSMGLPYITGAILLLLMLMAGGNRISGYLS